MSVRVKVGVMVDEAIRFRYEQRYGRYASLSWLLETAMNGMLALEGPDLAEQVKSAISAHIAKYNYNYLTEPTNDISPATDSR